MARIAWVVLLVGCGSARELGAPVPPPDPWPLGETDAREAPTAKAAPAEWIIEPAEGVRFEHVHVRCDGSASGQVVVEAGDVVRAAAGCSVMGESVEGEATFVFPDGPPGPVVCDVAGACVRKEAATP